MATRTRDVAPARQKRGTSPSATAQHRGRPSPSKTTSPADPTAPEKHIPNYLKPTISSGSDASKQQGKKPVTNHSTHNPTSTRRRSLDKSPLPSRTQKSHVSPNLGLRSSSVSGKTVSTQKLVPDKNLRVPKDAGKKNPLHARPVQAVKKSTVSVKKQGGESSSSAVKENITSTHETVENSDILNSPEPEIKAEDLESPVAEAEEQTSLLDGSNDENKTVVPEAEYQEPKIIEKIEAEIDKDVKTVDVESPKVEHQDTSLGDQTEEQEDKSQIEETSSKQQELKHTMNEIDSNVIDESVAGKPNEGVEEKEGEGAEAANLDKKEEPAIESEAHESKETEVQEVAEEKEKQESKNAAPKQQVAQGKRESAVSNDVIEETASQLREQRKNRVKALAGAFDKVISLQEPQG